MIPRYYSSRRDFLKTSLVGGLAAFTGHRLAGQGVVAAPAPRGVPARVALMYGEDRAAIAFNALKPFADDVRKAIEDMTGKKIGLINVIVQGVRLPEPAA